MAENSNIQVTTSKETTTIILPGDRHSRFWISKNSRVLDCSNNISSSSSTVNVKKPSTSTAVLPSTSETTTTKAMVGKKQRQDRLALLESKSDLDDEDAGSKLKKQRQDRLAFVDEPKSDLDDGDAGSKFYEAQFAKPSTRKRKSMEDDGYVIISGKTVVLKDSKGEVLGSSMVLRLSEENLTGGKLFNLGGKEVLIIEEISNPFKTRPSNRKVIEQSQQSLKRLKEDRDLKEAGEVEPAFGESFQSVSDSASTASDSASPGSTRIKDECCNPSSGEQIPTHSVVADSGVTQRPIAKESKCYEVTYGKPSGRKHKVMELDGFLIVQGTSAVLKTTEGNIVGSSKSFKLTDEMIAEEQIFRYGGKDVQIFGPVDNPFGEDSTSTSTYVWDP